MAETERFDRFKEHLQSGNVEGVRETITSEYLEKYICLGKKPIHLACENGHLEIVNLLIEKKCNIESETTGGLRPIHFACLSGHIEIVKLLITRNCLINVTDRLGQTLLKWAESKGHWKILEFLSELDKINDSMVNDEDEIFAKFYKSDLLTGRDWLEMALENKQDKIIKYFLNRPIDVNEVSYIKTVIENHPSESTNAELWEEVLLYKTIKDHHEKGFQSICKANIINRPTKIIPCSFLEFAAENENFIFFQEIMRKTLYNSERWKGAKEIAFKKGYNYIHKSILNREYLLKCNQENNVSILHTAVSDNDPDMLEYIFKKGLVDPDQNHEVMGTALAFAILLCHRQCLTIFKDYINNIDCDTQNKYFQSPLHEAISNGMIIHCQYLIDRVKNIDQPGFMGQTALHCAVIRGNEKLCGRLIEKGADCLRDMEFCQPSTEEKGSPISKDSLQLSQRENSLTLCLKMNKTIYSCFLNSLDRNKANSSDAEGNSLLHLTAKLLDPQLCDVFLQAGANVDSENKKGNTPLFGLLSDLNEDSFTFNEDKIIETVNLFVQSEKCDLKKSLKGDLSLFNIISKFNCERLLIALLPRQQNQLFEINEHILKIALERHFYRFCETLLKVFPKAILTSSITKNVIEEAVKDNYTTLLKSLVMNATDDVQQIVSELSLYHLAKLDDKDSFDCLLNIEVNNPLCFENGETLLTRLLKEKEIYFCQRIIESKKNKKKYINLKNKKKQTPLQVAIKMGFIDLAQDHLIFETDSLDNMDYKDRSALIQLFAKVSNNTEKNQQSRLISVIKAMICNGGNIYHETPGKEKAIEFCFSHLVREEIEKFQNDREKNKERESVVVREIAVQNICGVCLDREVDSVFECGHTICEICSSQILRCPFCNFESVRARRIFFQ